MPGYIHGRAHWPHYEYDLRTLMPQLERTLTKRGTLFGILGALGFEDLQDAQLAAIASEIVRSSAIEGERLDPDAVTESVARRLGIERGGLPLGDHYTEGVVEMAMDAGRNHADPLTDERLFNWHAALFPTGRNVYGKIKVGTWRDDEKGPMEVVSRGRKGRTIVHFEAPPADRIPAEMATFLAWFEKDEEASEVLKAAIAHLWFVTIHPMDDGNGRIGRAILDLGLARADARPYRCYSVSARIEREKDGYYDALERAQKGVGDYTAWLGWFLGCFERAIDDAISEVAEATRRTRFWQHHRNADLNERQRKGVSRMLSRPGEATTNKRWSSMLGCSDATATRDLDELRRKGVLDSNGVAGRGRAYTLASFDEEA